MKKIAIISLAIAPLFAGCAGDHLGPRIDPELAQQENRSQSRSVARLQTQLKKLRRRVSRLNRRIAAGTGSVQPTAGSSAVRNDLNEVKQRVAELENAVRRRQPTAPATTTGQAPLPPDLSERLALLNQKLDGIVQAQRAAEERQASLKNERDAGRALVEQRFSSLNEKVAALESRRVPGPAAPSNNQSSAAVEERIARAEATLKSYVNRQLNQKLDRIEQSQRTTAAQQIELKNSLDRGRAQLTERLASVRSKLAALEAAQKSSAASSGGRTDPALTQRLSKAEASLKAYLDKHDKLEKELERDRTLVVDYLEDLDKRLTTIESAPLPTQPGKP